MEDQIVEWRVAEHTYFEGDEDDEDEEDEEEVKESKMRWVVNKGLWLGKKVVITGMVVSSAPVVLPPLFVISAIGFAVSVPFGIAFAGYTCTERLMNKLLPRPDTPLLLGYGVMYGDEGEHDEQLEGKSSGFGREMVMEEEEKEELEDVKGGVEMRIELVMDESRGYEEDKDFGIAEDEREINVDEGGKEEGYEEDVGEYLEGENEMPMKEMNLEIERGRESENWEFGEDIKRTEGLDLVAREVRGEDEGEKDGEKDVTLTPDRNLVEVYGGDEVKEDAHNLKNEDEKDTRSREMIEKPLESKDAKVDSLVAETHGPEVTLKEKESIEVAKKPNVSKSSKKHHKKKKVNEGKTPAKSEEGEGLSNKRLQDHDVKPVEIKEEVREPVKRETEGGGNEVTSKAKKAAETDKAHSGNRDTRHGRDVGHAAKSTKDHKVAFNGKHAAKDVSGASENRDAAVAGKEAQRKSADTHGNQLPETKGAIDHKKSADQVSGRVGVHEGKHVK